jgi:hypothetical protein
MDTRRQKQFGNIATDLEETDDFAYKLTVVKVRPFKQGECGCNYEENCVKNAFGKAFWRPS